MQEPVAPTQGKSVRAFALWGLTGCGAGLPAVHPFSGLTPLPPAYQASGILRSRTGKQ